MGVNLSQPVFYAAPPLATVTFPVRGIMSAFTDLWILALTNSGRMLPAPADWPSEPRPRWSRSCWRSLTNWRLFARE
jgi:hypothetical protein